MSKAKSLKINFSINNNDFGSIQLDPVSTIEQLTEKVLTLKNISDDNHNYIILYNNKKVENFNIIKDIIGNDSTPLFSFKNEVKTKSK